MHGQNIAKAVLISKLKLARRRHFQYRVSCTVCGPWVIRGTGCPILKIASMSIRYTPAMVRTRLEPYSSPVVTGFEPRLGIRFQQNSNPINSPFEPALKRVRNPIHRNPAMTSNPLRRRGGLDFIILKASPPAFPRSPWHKLASRILVRLLSKPLGKLWKNFLDPAVGRKRGYGAHCII